MNRNLNKLVMGLLAASVMVTVLVLVMLKSRTGPEVLEIKVPSVHVEQSPIVDSGPGTQYLPVLAAGQEAESSDAVATPVKRTNRNQNEEETRQPYPLAEPPMPVQTVSDDRKTTTILGQEFLVGPDGEVLDGDENGLADRAGYNPYVTGNRPGGTEEETDSTTAAQTTDRPDGEEDGARGDQMIGGLILRGDKPIEGAILSLEDPDGKFRRARSQADGSYRFTGLSEGAHTVTLLEPPAPNARRGLHLSLGENRANEDFVLPALSPVRGDVLGDGDVGIEGAMLMVWHGTQMLGHTRSGREGAFELFPLEPGSYTLKGTAEGHLPSEVSFNVATHGESERVRLKMDSTRRIRGQVVSPANEPIRGAYVSLFGNAAWNDPYANLGIKTTDAGGFFEFSAPPQEEARQPFRPGAYGKNFVPAYGPPVNLTEMASDPVVIVLGEGGTLAGRVVDEEDAPIEGVEVSVTEGFQNTAAIFQRMNQQLPKALTARDGSFRLPAVEEGPATIVIALEGYVSITREINITAGLNNLGDITLEGGDSAKAGRLFGMVVDERGKPMVSHNVYVRHNGTLNGYPATTDSRGGFRFDDLPPGSYTLFTNGSALRGDLYMTMDQVVPDVKPGGEMVYIPYDLGQTARLKVVDDQGSPIRNFRVRVRIRESGPGSAKQGMDYERNFQTSNGEATLEHLLAGMANITVMVDSVGTKELDAQRIMVASNSDLGEVIIGSGASLEGVVVAEENGAAVGGVLVTAVSPEGSPGAPVNITTTADVGGNFRLRGLPARELDIIFSRAGWVARRMTGVSIKADEANRLGEVALERAATLSGRVVNLGGSPVRDVQIWIGSLVIFTDREGRYFSDNLPPGQASLTFRDPSGRHAEETRQVSLTHGQPATLDVEMKPAG